MINLGLQYFGGRGASGGGGGQLAFSNGKWSGNVGNQIGTLKDALGTRGNPKSMASAMLDSNPNYNGDYKEFSQNCQRVVVAYEARRRGYDVEAQPTFKGDNLNKIAYDDTTNNVMRGRWMMQNRLMLVVKQAVM